MSGGCWFTVEPGTNPGFLYQQNTVRDALVAGITLNIFNKHCDRVKMANLAQMVNVLQSVILTEGPKMIKTRRIMYSICTGIIRCNAFEQYTDRSGRNRYRRMESSGGDGICI